MASVSGATALSHLNGFHHNIGEKGHAHGFPDATINTMSQDIATALYQKLGQKLQPEKNGVKRAILRWGGTFGTAFIAVLSACVTVPLTIWGVKNSNKSLELAEKADERADQLLNKEPHRHSQNTIRDGDMPSISEKTPSSSSSLRKAPPQSFIPPPRESAMPQGGDNSNGVWA